ncbi:VOC family protein [Curvivirga aplysinae]|uniref:VOC family protein n=1 Tax=Curvivirga aplysinae TaxID=2529852 RepID=UPI0012BCA882|nr:VOC family protein [Curvivirga aplysinae]MTI09532.1 glyoxalase [Curvivirga aplysinae]
MKISSYYPVLCVNNVQEMSDFYQTHFGFEVGFDSDWYVHLTMKEQPHINLAFVKSDHPSVPEMLRQQAQGIILNFEVEDVDDFYDKMKAANMSIKLELRDEDWGQRHFIMTDPAGAMIDVIKLIPPSAEFQEQYTALSA